MALSNASLLDEATAAAEAMSMCYSLKVPWNRICYAIYSSKNMLCYIFK